MPTRANLHDQMAHLLGGYRVTQMLHVAASLGLADRLAHGPVTVDRLARETNSDRDSLYRLLRSLASLGVFSESADREFVTTDLADVLRSDAPDSLEALALSYGAPWWWRSFGELLHCVQAGEDGFRRANGVALFDYLNQHPEAARLFNANMSAMTRAEAAAFADAWAFDGVRLFVDVGGGHGVLAREILARWPDVSAVLFDQPSVIESAGTAARGAPSVDRCVSVSGDFFSVIPRGADVYILKDILHDWDDDRATTILRNCRDAMPARARLLVIERIVEAGNAPSAAKEVDITMLVMTGGRERTAPEYEALLHGAGLSMRRSVKLSTGGSILKAVGSEGSET